MGELLQSVPHSCTAIFSSSSSFANWDHLHQHLGVVTPLPDISLDGYHEMMMDPLFAATESDVSTGYLEDALIEINGSFKRKRMASYRDDYHHTGFDEFDERHWVSDWDRSLTTADNSSYMSDNNNKIKISKTETTSESYHETIDSSSSSYRDSTSKTSPKTITCFDKTSRFGGKVGPDHSLRKKKNDTPKKVYPFALVKPGGREDDVTLNDINEQILMPPMRPLRHPVGDFAYRPCISLFGPGLSGKAVVALTRIHTRGRGTITIIRTKG